MDDAIDDPWAVPATATASSPNLPAVEEKTPLPVSADNYNNDDDEFGDFGGFSSAAPQLAPPSTVICETHSSLPAPAAAGPAGDADDDEFGDFGDFSDSTNNNPPVAGQLHLPPPSSAAIPPVLVTLASRLPEAAQTQAHALAAALASTVPQTVVTFAPETAASLLTRVVGQNASAEAGRHGAAVAVHIVPDSQFARDEWAAVWASVAQGSETAYSGEMLHKFRWKKSSVYSEFLKASGFDEELLDHTSAAADSPAGLSQAGAVPTLPIKSVASNATEPALDISDGAPLDLKQKEVEDAKKLCVISEDEIRKMTTDELAQLVQGLAQAQVKLQEQSNYWLDSKEQLMMDAEMHNKMIASLVQYATQGPKASPRVAKAGLFGKKKK
ncbi:hypothetical protein HDU83_000732 [Entophlyctis luteolus]|nr:hypothetical protein HDU83_000732 [Entophlyctis luteolus]